MGFCGKVFGLDGRVIYQLLAARIPACGGMTLVNMRHSCEIMNRPLSARLKEVEMPPFIERLHGRFLHGCQKVSFLFILGQAYLFLSRGG